MMLLDFAGFKLATLLKLTFLRDDNNKSLLHFVLDEMTDAGSISDKLIHQLASTPSAADIQVGVRASPRSTCIRCNLSCNSLTHA